MNEIDAETKKAARGAGFSWGMAEEVGYAMAWLSRHGIDAMPALLDLLEAHASDKDRPRDAAEALSDEEANDRPCCPISLGVAIADRANHLATGAHIQCGPVSHPILIVPFIAAAAKMINRPVFLDCGFGSLHIAAEVPDPGPFAAAIAAEIAPYLRCHADDAAALPIDQITRFGRLELAPEAWQRLKVLAARTYVPASEQSRILGAGAGAIDND